MDSTLINIECVDEIADVVGRKAEVAEITEAAMRGEIADYKDSLRRRVALLAGVPEAALQQVYDERLQLNPGVETFVARLPRRGAEDAAGLGRLHLLQRAHPPAACSWTSRAPTRWAWPTAGSPARCSTAPGATSSTAPRRSACCWRCAN